MSGSATGYATREEIAKVARRVVLPPASPISHAEFCRTLTIPDGPMRGTRYNPDADPVHAAICREITRGGWQRIVGVGAVQTGKSLAMVLAPMLRHLTLLRQPVVYSQPTLTKLHEAWAGKLLPSIRESGYGGWLPIQGQGAKGSQTPKFITYRDPATRARAGTQYMIPGGGSSEAAQAGVTGRLVAVDEIDSFPDRHRVELVAKRADSYGPQALRVYTSTVKHDGDSGADASIILALYNESTASRLWFCCPACNHWQTLEWENVSYLKENEPQAIASARYACAGCGAAWTEDDRQRALRSWRLVHSGQQVDQATGAVVGVPPLTVAFGLLWTSLDSSLRSLGQMAAEHWRAERAVALADHGPMRSFFRDQLCRPYRADVGEDGAPARITCGYLAARSKVSTYALQAGKEVHDEDGDSIHVAERPDGIEFLTIIEDVQQGGQRAPGRNYFLVQGWAADRRSWDLSWGSLVACPKGRTPSESELHTCLDRVGAHAQEMPKYFGVPLLKRGVDVGDRLPEIRRWLARNPSWLAVRGVESTRKALEGDIQGVLYRRKQDGGWFLYEVDVHEMRQRAQNGFLVPSGSPGAAHLPEGLKINSSLIQHYCATALIPDNRSGLRWSDRKEDREHHGDWQTRRDLLDCRTYGCALAEYQIRDLTRKPPPKRKYGVVGQAFGV